eukprot:4829611-Pyramimonas_sp.AAC.1
MVDLLASVSTRTGFVCPMRCARHSACRTHSQSCTRATVSRTVRSRQRQLNPYRPTILETPVCWEWDISEAHNPMYPTASHLQFKGALITLPKRTLTSAASAAKNRSKL